MRVRTEEGDGRAARLGCGLCKGKIIPDDRLCRAADAHGPAGALGLDLDPASAGAAGRRYDRICPTHRGHAERVDGAHGMEMPTEKFDAMFRWAGGKWIGIGERGRRWVQREEVMRLKFDEDRAGLLAG